MSGRPARLPRRPALPPDAHKGSRGRVLVVAGSPGMTGAAFLAGEAALAAGAGLVSIAVPESVNAILEVKTTAVMTRPLPETKAGTLSPRGMARILELARAADAVAIGPGIGRHGATDFLVRRLIGGAIEGTPIVVDADGLNAIAEVADAVLGALATDAVLTPHPGEMARLVASERSSSTPGGARAVQENREAVARAFAAKHPRVTLLLKGPGTIVASGDAVYVNTSGGPALATPGSGDVLTGLIAGLLARGLDPTGAARLGAWIHGRSGDTATRRLGADAVDATTILGGIAEALREDGAAA